MDTHIAALAGLLHDIGKFWQRAAATPQHPLPEGYTSATHKPLKDRPYVAWSAAFVEQVLPEPFREAVYQAILYQNNPQDALGWVVRIADRFANGEQSTTVRYDEHPAQLQSIFCNLAEENMPAQYWALRPLSLDKRTLFPQGQALEVNAARQAYQTLWNDFYPEARALHTLTDIQAYIESMQALMMRYCWGMPAMAYKSGADDISLYDHSRTTAAFAAVLAATQDADTLQRLWEQKLKSDAPLAAFVEGDISGVQKFIYTITAKGAAKSLRARSFYLQVLSEAAARYILHEFGMPSTNLLYVGGGHFYLLVPPSDPVKLDAVRAAFADFMLTHHDGELYLALGAHPLSAIDVSEPRAFSKAWAAVGKSTNADKRRQYAQLSAAEQAARIFEPRAYSPDTELGKRRAEREEGSEEDKSELSAALHALGGAMRNAAGMVLVRCEAQNQPAGDVNTALAQLGALVALVDERGELLTPLPNQQRYQHATLLGFHVPFTAEVQQQLSEQLGCAVASGLRYTVNVLPQSSKPYEQTASFSDLQDAARGVKRFGVLRMDVDDLGQLFARGFGDGNPSTLARVASLSFALSVYFEGWVGELCRDINQREKRSIDGGEVQPLYTVYSGGDDLFIVGAWDVLPMLAERIRTDLTRFAVGNPRVHVSGGITLHAGKYPLYQAAEEAEDALGNAKGLGGKNAVSFLGEAVTWEKFQLVQEAHTNLLDIHAHKVPRSLFQLLLSFYAEYEATREKYRLQRTHTDQPQIVWGAWLWHSAYQLKRMADRHKDQQGEIMALQDRMKEDQFAGVRYVGIAARWAEALTRSERQDKE